MNAVLPATIAVIWIFSRQLIPCLLSCLLFRCPQFAGYNEEVLDVRFLGPADSHIVVATNSPQLKVFELATSHCQILYGHTGMQGPRDLSALQWAGRNCVGRPWLRLLSSQDSSVRRLQCPLILQSRVEASALQAVCVEAPAALHAVPVLHKKKPLFSRAVGLASFTSTEISLNSR